MMFLWVASAVPFGAYFIGQRSNMALQIQPQLFCFFCSISFAQTLFYPPVHWPRYRAFTIWAITLIMCGGLQCALIFPLRPLNDKGIHWPLLIVGIVAAVLLAGGLIPPYFELWKYKGRVVGINFVFLSMDSLGALFSMLSVFTQDGDDIDILGVVLYAVVLALEIGIFASHSIWAIRVRWFGLPVDDLPEEQGSAKCETDTISAFSHVP